MSVTTNDYRHHQRITIVSETFAPEINGVANTLGYLCRNLMQRGHRVSVVRPAQGPERGPVTDGGDTLCCDEYTVTAMPLPGYPGLQLGLARAATLSRLWRQQRPDVIYVATPGPLGIAAVTAARHLDLPVASGFHTNFHSYSRHYGAGFLESLLRVYGRWFYNRTDITLAPTRRMAARVQAMGIARTGVWSRGVDCQRFAPQKRDPSLRQRWGLRDHDPAVLYVGRLASEKNLQLAVSCYERIRALHPRARFVLVGDGPMAPRLQQRHPDYIFCGIQRGEALARHYASGDLFLFPSKTDTFGNVVTEAMASGLGVVAFDDAAASEHVRHEENGMKCALDDNEGFVQNALRLTQQSTLLGRLRAQARLDAMDLDWNTQTEQFERLIMNPSQKARYHAPTRHIPLI